MAALSVLLLAFLALGPRTGLYRPITVLSNSMSPTFSRGDLLIVTPRSTDSVRVGQVVTFRIPVGDHRVESHRIVDILAGGMTPVVRTKGDANDGADPWNAQLDGDSVWTVSATVPKLGWLIVNMRDPRIRLLALFLVPALLVLRLLLRIWFPGRARLPRPHRRARTA